MTLAETQRLFYAAVTGAAPVEPAEVSACVTGSPELAADERVDIYAGMYRMRLVDALREELPKLAALLGDDAFTEMAEAYVQTYPSQNPDLGQLGVHLERFLRERSAAAPRPDLADLAALEWARSDVFFEAPLEPMGREAFAALDGVSFASAQLRMVPALRLLMLDHDVATLWQQLESGEPPSPPTEQRTAIAVWRPDLQVLHVPLELDEALALQRVMAGSALADACAAFEQRESPAEAAFEALGSWADEGWIAQLVPAATGTG